MSNIQYFFRENNKQPERKKYIATNRFRDDEGKPIEWELKPIPTDRIEEIKDQTKFYQDTDKMMGRFAMEVTVASIAFPPLRDQKLQDSYGVKDPEKLLCKLLNAAELDMLKVEALKINGYGGESLEELSGEAKNS